MIRSPALLFALAAVALLAFPAVAVAQDAEDEPEMEFEEDDLSEPDSGDTSEGDEGEMDFEEDDLSEPDSGDTSEGDEGEMDFEEDDLSEPELELDEDEPLEEPDADAGDVDLDQHKQWQDIVVVMRKPFLKRRRLELMPIIGVTTNDNLIRHTQLGAQLNYFLTDVLSVGVEGALYQSSLREPYELIARQARRLPTVNEYNYSGALNFNYAPIHGKFAFLDTHILQWDASLTAGVGITESEVIPRNPAFQSFTNRLVTPNVGASMRMYFNDYLTIHLGLRDYIFLDRYEDLDRTEINGNAAQENANSALVNHVMLQAGLSFWFPTSFSYSTFR